MWWVLASQLLFYFWDCIDNGLAEYWHRISIDTVLSQDWHRFGIGFRQDWHCIDGDEVWQSIGFRLTPDWQWHRSGTGFTSNCQLIDNGLAMDLHSSGFDLTMDWNWIGSIRLVTNWHWIGNRQPEGLSLSDCSEWMCALHSIGLNFLGLT